MHSFLLIGQSNAAGRGFVLDAAPIDTCEGRVKVQRNGRWWPAYRPMNPDRVTSGVCLAESFAKKYATAHPDVEVGIIPCADGGTSLSQWMPGEVLFENAVNHARLAMRTSHIKGILWHQGESDCSPENVECYAEKFKVIMNAIRASLGMPDLPIIVGGLGDFLENYESVYICKNFTRVNGILENLEKDYHRCAFASAKGLGANPDNLHFCAAALLEFGKRYYEAFLPFDSIQTDEDRSVAADAPKKAIELL
jgi:hypothetical protein